MRNKQQIQKRITQTEMQIKKLSLQNSKNEICEDLYNSLILQKAILKKELDELNKNPIVEAVKRIVPRKEKLICDYFS